MSGVCAIVPVKALDHAKMRLSPLMNVAQRRRLSLLMLEDVAQAIQRAKRVTEAVVVTSDQHVLLKAREFGLQCIHEYADEGVNEAVEKATTYCAKKSISISVVVPADLPTLSPFDIDYAVGIAKQRPSVVVSPSFRLDGTNLLVRNPYDAIPTDYEKHSFHTHVQRSVVKQIPVRIYISSRIQLDIDTPADLKLLCRKGHTSKSRDFILDLFSKGVVKLNS